MSRRDKKKSTKEKITIAMLMGGEYLPYANLIMVVKSSILAEWYCATRLIRLSDQQARGRIAKRKVRKGPGGYRPR